MLSKDTLDKIQEMVLEGAQVKQVNGLDYCHAHLIPVREPEMKPLQVNTLTALRDYIVNRVELSDDRQFVHIASPSQVYLFEEADCWAVRQNYMLAVAPQHSFSFGTGYLVDDFIVALQSSFVITPVVKDMLKLVGNITANASLKTEDDGVSQTVTAKVGIVKEDQVRVPNPVTLRPYRTFPEIEQPEMQCVFRISGDTGSAPVVTLSTIEDPRWTVDAAANIKKWLKDNNVEMPIV